MEDEAHHNDVTFKSFNLFCLYTKYFMVILRDVTINPFIFKGKILHLDGDGRQQQLSILLIHILFCHFTQPPSPYATFMKSAIYIATTLDGFMATFDGSISFFEDFQNT